MKISLCDGWEFSESWSWEFLNGEGEADKVRLPHNVKELPLHYASPEYYEMVCGYRRKLDIPSEYLGKRLFLTFDGAAHIAEVYVNGGVAGAHRTGYTAFSVEISDLVHEGENDIAVKLDCTENPTTPPFGFVIDYLTYGGLYREAWLEVHPQDFIEDVFVYTPTLSQVIAEIKTSSGDGNLRLRVVNPDGKIIYDGVGFAGKNVLGIRKPRLWSIDTPNLYTLIVNLGDDEKRVTFGVRTAEFRKDGFYLNGEKIFLRGLNRHQCWPYIGYAAPESMQREDAKILKNELGVNAVRTSHYPQSQHFIDECDRLGLCVFTEIPGWQHIGDLAWQAQAVENVREMITQYRNHPSIVLWGVRINESVDNDDFYKKTNALAHQLDPSRQTSGVRYIEKSSLLEDVYAFNDFSHVGTNAGCRPKNKVTPDMEKPLLISEHSGHMFPTKSYDTWEKRQEHALRHARVIDAAMADGEHTAVFGWCMFDYATHKDFGSGDKICYHGVMDSFRNPKLAAYTYMSQSEAEPVLEIGSPYDIGDYAGGNLGSCYIFTNADEVRLYKNDNYVTTFRPQGWKGIKHGPILVEDMIGELLKTQEGFTGQKEKLLRECLVAAGKYGMSNLPPEYLAKMAWVMARYGLKYEDGVRLYGKYIGNWGGEATRWRFDAVKNGEVVKSVTKRPGSKLHLEVRSAATELKEGASYDMTLVRIRVLDEFGNPAPYAQLPVELKAEGDIELAGPDIVTAEGGMCGCFVKTTATSGSGRLTVRAQGCEPVIVEYTIGG